MTTTGRTEVTPADVAARVDEVRARVADLARSSGRSPEEVTIVAVSKTHPPSLAQAAVDAGLVDLGENRVREFVEKRSRVRGARWHVIGRLQRNKARQVVAEDALLHSVDRRSLVDTLARIARDGGVRQRILVQVNVGDDPAKGGCPFDETLELVAYARASPELTVEGLMTVPPLPPDGDDHDEHARPHFAALAQLRDRAREEWPEVVHLSMGMSDDLAAAVTEGATIVRLGTAVFGPRGTQPWRPDGGART